MRRFIGVIGASEAAPDLLEVAEEVGRLIAMSGNVLVCVPRLLTIKPKNPSGRSY